ncbi:MAG: glycosyltransferase family 2 protein [Parachlamydia sp.]|nr:glycosyltransferase family 2 protein [Parachlamydia sp.]
MTVTFSVVIPMKNEEGNVADLIEELHPIMAALKEPWELICIDDGSTDGTLTLLKELAKQHPWLRVVSFSRNYGQSSAFDAGFKLARGSYVITLDGDRQNDPADIPKLVQAVKDCDLVCGYRANRRDPLVKKITSFFANQVRKRVCQDGVRDTGCSLKIYRREALQKIKMFQGMHRFLPALFKIEGFKVAEVAVNHRERTRGKTNYSFMNRSFNTIADMLAVRWMRKRALRYQIRNIED